MLLGNLLVRIWHRVLDIPKRGLPQRAKQDSFDSEYGTSTAGVVWLTSPRSARFASGIRYEPCSPQLCESVIVGAQAVPGDFTFIDVGCGKGRPLIIAARFGFRQLIGVEYSAALCSEAKRNLAKCGIRGARIVNADAAEFEYPSTDIFAFLYHPFQPDVFKMVLAKLKAATEGRQLVIAYIGDPGGLLTKQDWLLPQEDGPYLHIFRRRPEAARATA